LAGLFVAELALGLPDQPVTPLVRKNTALSAAVRKCSIKLEVFN